MFGPVLTVLLSNLHAAECQGVRDGGLADLGIGFRTFGVKVTVNASCPLHLLNKSPGAPADEGLFGERG